MCSADKSVVTVNRNPILADKSVALYFDIAGEIRYIYDTGHNELLIKEPFLRFIILDRSGNFQIKK